MEKVKQRSDFEAVNLLLFLWKGRKLIIGICALAAVGSIISALTIREKYRSEAYVFPAKSNGVTLFENNNPKDNVYNFGEEEESEQVVQILQSTEIRDILVERYDLFKHYDVDTSSAEKMYLLQGEYEENINIRRTRHGSIEISVMDWSPDTAALIANDLVQLIDSAKSRMIKERTYAIYVEIEKEYLSTEAKLETLVDSLRSLGKMGVVSKVERAELAAGYTKALIDGRSGAIEELRAQIEINNELGAVYSGITERLENETKRLTELGSVYKQAKLNYEATLSYIFKSQSAFPADKKSYPIRWLIVVMSCLSAFVFSIFLLIAIEKVKEMRSRLADERA